MNIPAPEDETTSPEGPAATPAAPMLSSWARAALRTEPYALAILFIAVFAFFSLEPRTSEIFLSHANLRSVISNQAVLGVLAIGSLAPLVCRNFDLSVGAVASLSQIAIASAMARFHLPIALALLIGLGIGAGVGVINGLVVTRLRVNALIATLGIGTVLGGLIQAYTKGQTIVSGISPRLVRFGSGETLSVPNVVFVLAVVSVLVWYLLTQLPFGRYLSFIGSNPSSARLVGVDVDRIVRRSFITSSLFASIGGALLVARNGTGDPQAGTSYMLQALSAAALGATAIRPGRYNVPGTLLAIGLLGFGVNGLTLHGVPYWINDVFFGGSLVIAVAGSTLLGRKRGAAA